MEIAGEETDSSPAPTFQWGGGFSHVGNYASSQCHFATRI